VIGFGIDFLRKQASDSTLTSDVTGQIELGAYGNCFELQNINVMQQYLSIVLTLNLTKGLHANLSTAYAKNTSQK